MQPAKLAEYAVRAILSMIAEGQWRVGDLLPSQRELADQLGISRPSLREAVSTLEGRGIIRSHPGKGMYLVSMPSDEAQQQLDRKALSPHDIYQLRYALEPFVVGLVAQTISSTELMQLQMNLMSMKAAIDMEDVVGAMEMELEFHRQLISFSTNPAFGQIVEQTAQALTHSRAVIRPNQAGMIEPWQELNQIWLAVHRHDSHAAMEAMRTHLIKAALRIGVRISRPDQKT